MSDMNSERQFSWRRYMGFDPMNAHSQADDPALAYVLQFNADERRCQEALSRIQHLPGSQQRSVVQVIDALLAQYGR